jgi:hypothetical protein
MCLRCRFIPARGHFYERVVCDPPNETAARYEFLTADQILPSVCHAEEGGEQEAD